MVDQSSLPATFWGMCFIMAIKQRNFVPNVLCPESSPSIEITGVTLDVQLSGTHYFGEVVVVPQSGYRSGKKMAIGVPRNELARVVGFGDVRNGGWLVHRVAKPTAHPVQRFNPQSITSLDDDTLSMVLGKQWMPVKMADGTLEIKSRAPVNASNECPQWVVGGSNDEEVDLLTTNWYPSTYAQDLVTDLRTDLDVRGTKTIALDQRLTVEEAEDEILSREVGVRRSGRVRASVDAYTPEDKNRDERDYEWESHFGLNGDIACFAMNAKLGVITHKSTLLGPDSEKWQSARDKEMAVRSRG
jgi:hypothetical protein